MGYKADWTLYMVDDWKREYMYTFPSAELRGRVMEANAPEMFAPLVRAGADRAWTLLKTEQTKVSEAKRKRDTVKMLGADGDFDLLENLTGKATYDNRKLTETYLLVNDVSDEEYITPSTEAAWNAYLGEVENFLNSVVGKVRIVDSRNKNWYWIGRITAAVKDMKQHKATITITADIEPYRFERYSSQETWIWDDFNFIDGIIRDKDDYTVLLQPDDFQTLKVHMNNNRAGVVPLKVRCGIGAKTTPGNVTVHCTGVPTGATIADATVPVDCQPHEIVMEGVGDTHALIPFKITNGAGYPVNIAVTAKNADGGTDTAEYRSVANNAYITWDFQETDKKPVIVTAEPEWPEMVIKFDGVAITNTDGICNADGRPHGFTVPDGGTVMTIVNQLTDSLIIASISYQYNGETVNDGGIIPSRENGMDGYIDFVIPDGAVNAGFSISPVIKVGDKYVAVRSTLWSTTEFIPRNGADTVTIKNTSGVPLYIYCLYRGASL